MCGLASALRQRQAMSTPYWSLVLAGGAGRRLADLTAGVPKQFWSPDGGPTLLQRTFHRTALFAPPERTVVVVKRTHAPHVAQLSGEVSAHHWLYQPSDRGTAAAVLLGLAYIGRLAPQAIVLLTPSDHWVGRPAIFAQGVRRALEAVEAHKAGIVIFGVEPEAADADYGWIALDGRRDEMTTVREFVEKPSPKVARDLFARGAVWNTMVLVARGADLVRVYRERLPDLWGALIDAPYVGDLRLVHEHPRHYDSLPIADFSRDVIGAARNLSAYVWPAAMQWSDLGTPERLDTWRRSAASMAEQRISAVDDSVRGSSAGARASTSDQPLTALPTSLNFSMR
jgi:mannose-1-phosphate guanylyltransferase